MQISDTQYLAASYPVLFDNLTTWITNNSANYNLQMVVHTGDIVDNSSQEYQWVNANNSMGILLNAGIPYCWNAGNHDQTGNGNNTWNGRQYLAFQGSYMRQNTFWVDDCYDSKNTAVRFCWNNYSFLVINLEYHAGSSVLDWLKALLNESLNSNVIVATHSYLNSTAGYEFWGDYLWESNLRVILDEYPSVFLTLNGHVNLGVANMTTVGSRKEVFFNRQGIDDLTGAASARIYTFNLTSMQVNVRTYVIYAQSFLTDPYNQFSFAVTLQNDGEHNIFPYSHFWVAPTYQSYLSFSRPCSATSTTMVGSTWTFTNLSLNGVTSNLTVTTRDANMVMANYDPNGWINYTVSGSGTQALTAYKPPTTAYINGNLTTNGWDYQNETLTITKAHSAVALNFQGPTATQTTTTIPTQTTTSTPTSTTSTSTPTTSETPQPTSSASPSPSLTKQPNATPQNSALPTQTALVAVLSTAIIISPFALAWKKRLRSY